MPFYINYIRAENSRLARAAQLSIWSFFKSDPKSASPSSKDVPKKTPKEKAVVEKIDVDKTKIKSQGAKSSPKSASSSSKVVPKKTPKKKANVEKNKVDKAEEILKSSPKAASTSSKDVPKKTPKKKTVVEKADKAEKTKRGAKIEEAVVVKANDIDDHEEDIDDEEEDADYEEEETDYDEEDSEEEDIDEEGSEEEDIDEEDSEEEDNHVDEEEDKSEEEPSPVKHNRRKKEVLLVPMRMTASRKTVDGKRKHSQTNGHATNGHAEEPVERRSTRGRKISSPVKKSPASKRTRKEMSDSDEEEVVARPSKRRRNVIVDDSPVKVKAIISDDDDEKEAEDKKGDDDKPKEVKKEEAELSEDDGEEPMDVSTSSPKEEKKKMDSPVKESKPAISSFFKPRPKNSSPEKKPKASNNSKNVKAEGDNVFNPSKASYHPIEDACWEKGQPVPYLALAKTLEEIESISARLKMIEILSNFFRSVMVLTPNDLIRCIYLCLNRLAPEYEGIELGVGETILMKAVAQATGRTLDKIKAEVVAKGDLGIVAESSRGSQRVMFAFPKLTVNFVFDKFKEIAQMSGNSAMAKKADKIQALFSACRQCEARYIIRSLGGKLRIGLAEQSVLSALAQATLLTPPNQSFPPEIINSASKLSADAYKKKLEKQMLIIKSTYCECPNYDLIIPVLLKEDITELPKHCRLKPGIPLKPMLAHPTKGIEEVLQRFSDNEFTCEFKYDGERAQIHRSDSGEIRIYSRNQENNTSKYPDIISRLPNAIKEGTESFILDTEAVAWDKETKQILPFQVLSTRKRKDAVEAEITVQVCIVAFDLLYFNGESLVTKPLKERRSLLRESFVEVENEFMFVHSMDGNSAETMQEFLEESIKGKCEGLMVKSLVERATYEIAKRSHNWLKLKKDYLEGVGDTLDLTVLGAWYGKGKRTGTFGGFLLACYDDETEEFQTICKIGTGFKDDDLEAHNKFFKDHVIVAPKSYFRYDSGIEPEVWFEPVQVWEVKCADLSISPIHKAAIGIVDPEKGISLRFPRFLKIRDDKKPEDSSTARQVAEMYNNQEQVKNQKKNVSVEEEDFY